MTDAQYVKGVSSTYSDNPFLEALPPLLSQSRLQEALEYMPTYNDSIRTLPANERMRQIDMLQNIFVFNSMAADMYYCIDAAIIRSYSHIHFTSGRESQILYASPGTPGFGNGGITTFTASSGVGKTRASERALSMYPQVIRHKQYHGSSFSCIQITFIRVSTPHNCSPKSLCLEIVQQIDEAVGTDYFSLMMGHKYTLDSLTVKIASLCKIHHIGVIVIDESQNIRNQAGQAFLEFLVGFTNIAPTSLLLIGTPDVYDAFNRNFHLARRCSGLRYHPYSKGPHFSLLCKALWKYQFTAYQSPYTAAIEDKLYEYSQGITSQVSALISHCQRDAIISGKEAISPEDISRVFRYRLSGTRGFLESAIAENKHITAMDCVNYGDRFLGSEKPQDAPAEDALSLKEILHKCPDCLVKERLKECRILEDFQW